MDEKRYQALCETCDAALLAGAARLERVAIPWLHVIRAHPVFAQQYAGIPAGAAAGAFRPQRRSSLLHRLDEAKHLLRLLRSSRRLWFESDVLPARVDVLIVSHLLKPADAGGPMDFYFGPVPAEMARKGYVVVVALIDHSRGDARAMARAWKGGAVPRVILSRITPLATELKLWRDMRRESRRLKQDAQSSAGLLHEVFIRAADEAVLGGAIRARAIGYQIEQLVRRTSPRVLVVTHEGHAWERMAFASARMARPDITCVGYQHAALFYKQHALCRGLGKRYDPDHVLTPGLVSLPQLRELESFRDIRVSVLGSSRGFAPVKREDEITRSRGGQQDEGRESCLVLPEGIISECNLLFEFSLACAAACPEVDFIWRLHPLITFESLQAQNRRLRSHPANVRLSRGTLEADLAASTWSLYRGSTAVIQAVGAGLRPVYLQVGPEMTVDPLHELSGWKAVVTTAEEFRRLAAGEKQHDSDGGDSPEAVRQYCREMFTPFDAGALRAIVDAARPEPASPQAAVP